MHQNAHFLSVQCSLIFELCLFFIRLPTDCPRVVTQVHTTATIDDAGMHGWKVVTAPAISSSSSHTSSNSASLMPSQTQSSIVLSSTALSKFSVSAPTLNSHKDKISTVNYNLSHLHDKQESRNYQSRQRKYRQSTPQQHHNTASSEVSLGFCLSLFRLLFSVESFMNRNFVLELVVLCNLQVFVRGSTFANFVVSFAEVADI